MNLIKLNSLTDYVHIIRGGDNMKKGVMMQGFEWYLPSSPHLWIILRVNAYKLKKAGITAIWLPPAYKGANGVNDTGYGVYDHYDLGEFNNKNTSRTKYGTKKEYLWCIRCFIYLV